MKEQSEFDKCNQDLMIHGTSIMLAGKRIPFKDFTIKAGGENFTVPNNDLYHIKPLLGANGEIAAFQPDHCNKEKIEEAVNILSFLAGDERLEVFGQFCHSCGIHDNRCQCGNEE